LQAAAFYLEGIMKKVLFSLVVFVSAAAVMAPAANEPKEGHRKTGKHAGLERFKQLAGKWSGTELMNGKEAGKVELTYKVTSAGSAVVETIFPDGEHEMVTVIHPDGKGLALTHYCALGNQPHMRAEIKNGGNKVEFKFVSASNMKSAKDMHMHDVTYTFVDKDTLKAEWTHYDDGKKHGAVVFELKRKK
jgi:ribosome-associated toxin RatA of RatAB toxin-antitoxin module